MFISLKKNLITMSWVIKNAKKPKKGLILLVTIDFFFKLIQLYVNNL